MAEEIKTKLTFWGGLDTIGGNIVTIQSGNYRIMTDFGALFGAKLEELLDSTLTSDLLAKGHLPAIDGLYPVAQLGQATDLTAYETSDIQTIICLSHLHLDHIGSFGQLPSQLPIYALQDSVNFYQQLAELSLLPSYQVNWQGVQSEAPFQFGPFTIEFVASDHDTIGAASIFITAPDLKVVNSGDFRLSGFYPERVLHWAEKARQFEPDLFLVEGTTFSFDETSRDERMQVDEEIRDAVYSISAKNERKLVQLFDQVLKEQNQRPIALNVYPQNIERLVEFAVIAMANERELVLEPNYYQLLSHYISASTVIRYIDLDGTTDLPKEDAVTFADLVANPARYVVQVDYEQQHDYILDLPNGVYIHSNGVPLGNYDPRYTPWLQQIVAKGWDFYHAHVSGHASKDALCLVNYVVNPAKVVPWHTFKPVEYAAALQELGLATWLPEIHVVYSSDEISDL